MNDVGPAGKSLPHDHELRIKELIKSLIEAQEGLENLIAGQADAVVDHDHAHLILLHKAQMALQESESRYRHLVINLSAVVFELSPDGTICFVNDSVTKITGYAPSELLQKNCWDIFYPGQRRRQAEAFYSRLQSEDVSGYELGMLAKDGSEIIMEWNTANEYRADGVLEKIIGLGINITDRKRAEEELRAYADQLASSNKDLEFFSSSVSHDLRSPLYAMKDHTLIIMENYADKLEPEVHEYLQRILSSLDKMSELINDMLNLSKVSREEMNPQQISLSDIADAVVNVMRQAEPTNKVDVAIAEHIETRGDSRLMGIALSNLIGNAWKYSSKTPNPRIEFGEMEKDGQKIYYVRDNGAGFDMKFADRLFTPFKRLHANREYPGTGVGLAIVKRVIEKHRGTIWSESEPGKGATFYFTLFVNQQERKS